MTKNSTGLSINAGDPATIPPPEGNAIPDNSLVTGDAWLGHCTGRSGICGRFEGFLNG